MKKHFATLVFVLICCAGNAQIRLPRLEKPPVIDGNLSEWKEYAFHDGVWDIYRVRNSHWYDPKRNRLTDHGNEPSPDKDLASGYYMAWDSTYLYFGAEVTDNVNDVNDSLHNPERWYYKDCVCWFIEAPSDTIAESFGRGDNAFCFIADKRKPPYGVWWRHGSADKTFIEQALPGNAYSFALKMGQQGNYIIEARVNMTQTLGISDPSWQPPRVGDVYRVEIVHTDPDGGQYGGHLLIYGKGDDDKTWSEMILSPPQAPVIRNKK
ncbi:MAG: sugar-binding protein [Agriterribacter sp.]